MAQERVPARLRNQSRRGSGTAQGHLPSRLIPPHRRAAHLHLPSPADQPSDIIPLFRHFFREAMPGREPCPRCPRRSESCLVRRPYPGNVRDLRGLALRTHPPPPRGRRDHRRRRPRPESVRTRFGWQARRTGASRSGFGRDWPLVTRWRGSPPRCRRKWSERPRSSRTRRPGLRRAGPVPLRGESTITVDRLSCQRSGLTKEIVSS